MLGLGKTRRIEFTVIFVNTSGNSRQLSSTSILKYSRETSVWKTPAV